MRMIGEECRGYWAWFSGGGDGIPDSAHRPVFLGRGFPVTVVLRNLAVNEVAVLHTGISR